MRIRSIWLKRVGWVILGFSALVMVAQLVLRYPAPFFRYSVREQGLTLRCDQCFDAATARSILARVSGRLNAVAPGFNGEICITQSRWRRRLFFLPEPRAIGISYPYIPTVFISGAHVDRNRVVAPAGFEVGQHFTLEHIIGHEFGHVLTYRSAGAYRTLRQLPEWIREGIPEYVSGIDGFDFETDRQAFLRSDAIMGPPKPGVPPYRTDHLLVAFLLTQRGWTLERLLREAPVQSEVEGWLRGGATAGSHPIPR